jgi:hypothetical protein
MRGLPSRISNADAIASAQSSLWRILSPAPLIGVRIYYECGDL